jgi:glycerate-2-kinase
LGQNECPAEIFNKCCHAALAAASPSEQLANQLATASPSEQQASMTAIAFSKAAVHVHTAWFKHKETQHNTTQKQ